MRRYLVIAHQTLDSPRLEDAMLEQVALGPCSFHLIVPVLPKTEGTTWSEAQMRAIAQEHLNQALSRFRLGGFTIDGEVVGPNPVDAVTDLLMRGGPAYDRVLVSTLPHTISRWLRIDVPVRIARTTGLSVLHVEAPARALR